jgi:hypothetical protein
VVEGLQKVRDGALVSPTNFVPQTIPTAQGSPTR